MPLSKPAVALPCDYALPQQAILIDTPVTASTPTLAQLRRHAISRSLFAPTSLGSAIARLGFVQADPIRAPARAQDLTLRHRVVDYRAGDLERQYPDLPIEEDFFVNYGFLPCATQSLMHPRSAKLAWSSERWQQAQALRDWVSERGEVHPREVAAHFGQGTVKTGFGSAMSSTTHLLDGMHYRGLLRVARRDRGVRVYALREPTPEPSDPQAAFDALIDVAVAKYAPLPAATLGQLLSHLCIGAPQWRADRAAALQRAKRRLPHAAIDGVDWVWPAGEHIAGSTLNDARHDTVRLLAPFDPVVWDRRRFELFWGWAYRFEAYTPAAKRKLGYYALPLLWREHVIAWANVSVVKGKMDATVGYVRGHAPQDSAYPRELSHELGRMEAFLASAGPE